MKYAIILIVFMSACAPYASTGRGAGYRTDYAAEGRSQWRDRKEPNSFFVTRVVDGDTLRIGQEKVRLIGVDTPETKHPTKPVQYFGKEASFFTQREVEKQWVALDYEAHKRDKYGRLLAYVHRSSDNFFLNAELIKQGYGFAYTRFPFKYMNTFREYEKQARNEGRGLWGRNKEQPVPAIKQPEPPITTAPTKEPSKEPTVPELKVENKNTGDCKIKGNISRKGEKIYHLPGGKWYEKTEIVTDEGEQWFCTEEEAKKAGWRKAGG